MDIREIIRDILADKEINRKRQDDFSEFIEEKQRSEMNFFPIDRGRRARNTGILPIYLPQLFGMVAGFALARFFSGGAPLYLFLGIVGAVAFGTWKSCEFDQITLKYALVRNLIIAVPLIAAILIIVLTV